MNVWMLIYGYWPGPEGGTERQCRKLAHALVQKGHKCTVLTAKRTREVKKVELDMGCDVLRCNTFEVVCEPLLSLLKWLFRDKTGNQNRTASPVMVPAGNKTQRAGASIVRWLNALFFMANATMYLIRNHERIEVMHVHTTEWIAGFGAWAGRKFGIPVLCKESTFPVMPAIGKDIPCGTRFSELRSTIDFIALNEDMASAIKARGVPGKHIHLIPNSVEMQEESAEVSKQRGVLYVGNLTQKNEEKAFDVLINAWALVHGAEPDAKLTLLGAGDSSKWIEYAAGRGCEQSIEFAGFCKDPSAYYRGAGLLVLPSRIEGMSNALLEAQSWGLPAVVSDIPGNRAVVVNGETGIIVPVGDHKALADGILRLIRNSGLRETMGASARLRMSREFSIESVVNRLTSLYRQLVISARLDVQT